MICSAPPLETVDGIEHRHDSLSSGINACRMHFTDRHNCFERAALAERNHRRAARLRFHDRDAEVLFGSEYERARALQVIAQAPRTADSP